MNKMSIENAALLLSDEKTNFNDYRIKLEGDEVRVRKRSFIGKTFIGRIIRFLFISNYSVNDFENTVRKVIGFMGENIQKYQRNILILEQKLADPKLKVLKKHVPSKEFLLQKIKLCSVKEKFTYPKSHANNSENYCLTLIKEQINPYLLDLKGTLLLLDKHSKANLALEKKRLDLMVKNQLLSPHQSKERYQSCENTLNQSVADHEKKFISLSQQAEELKTTTASKKDFELQVTQLNNAINFLNIEFQNQCDKLIKRSKLIASEIETINKQ